MKIEGTSNQLNSSKKKLRCNQSIRNLSTRNIYLAHICTLWEISMTFKMQCFIQRNMELQKIHCTYMYTCERFQWHWRCNVSYIETWNYRSIAMWKGAYTTL